MIFYSSALCLKGFWNVGCTHLTSESASSVVKGSRSAGLPSSMTNPYCCISRWLVYLQESRLLPISLQGEGNGCEPQQAQEPITLAPGRMGTEIIILVTS